MSRENLKPIFRRLPKFALVALIVLVGLPFHLIAGTAEELRDGFSSWLSEFREAWRLDRPASKQDN